MAAYVIFGGVIIKKTIDEPIALKIREIIDEYHGGEIFFGCNLDEEGNLNDITPVCYGNEEAVLAPFEIVEKFNAILHNHPSGNIQPSNADLEYAKLLQNQGIGFFITDNEANHLNVVVPPIKLKKSQKIKLDRVNDYFAAQGIIAQKKSDYEFREGQLKMALAVTTALNENKISVIEAGTGIGKSIAYLLPAFIWAEENNERIVISTNTINLQSQLLNKDIPFVKKILNANIEAVLVKGRRNYLCQLKLYQLDSELEFTEEEKELNDIIQWSKVTQEGVVDELNFVPVYTTWEKVASDADFCPGSHCIFYSNCFLQKARRRASEANILIVNHHILFADLHLRSIGRGKHENIILPPYNKIIFDEAHNLEKSASSFFNNSFSKSGFYKFINIFRGKNNKGFLKNLSQRLEKSHQADLFSVAEYLIKDVFKSLDLLYSRSFLIFEKINAYVQKIIEQQDNKAGSKINIQYRIMKEEWESADFQEQVIQTFRDFMSYLESFSLSFKQLSEIFEDIPEQLKAKHEIDIRIVKAYSLKLESYSKNLLELLNHDLDHSVAWFDIFGDIDNPLFNLVSSPLYVTHFLKENLYEQYQSIVFASATLTVNQSFQYFLNLSGLALVDDREIMIDQFESPFNYHKQVLFIAPTDIPEPKSPLYSDSINEFMKKSIEITGGSAFVLFTSYLQLKRSFNEVDPYLREKGYRSFYQGELEKSKLLEMFKTEIESNLFATDSFWEGVDAPGKTLRFVILTKLPFRMPSEPIEEARVEDMKKKDLNPFIHYTLPSAVIRFKQGFGRLIRTKTDYGIVALLDSRVLNKSYGKIFFQSLPRCRFFSSHTEEIGQKMADFIREWE